MNIASIARETPNRHRQNYENARIAQVKKEKWNYLIPTIGCLGLGMCLPPHIPIGIAIGIAQVPITLIPSVLLSKYNMKGTKHMINQIGMVRSVQHCSIHFQRNCFFVEFYNLFWRIQFYY
ncbi:MAG: hypothetical protein H0W50_09140 [Parachlamydiaceae bacterium]|nr:hypothetical protein [Parachlamydiaceae bacterium]